MSLVDTVEYHSFNRESAKEMYDSKKASDVGQLLLKLVDVSGLEADCVEWVCKNLDGHTFVNTTDEYGATPALIAAGSALPHALKTLIDNDANLHHKDNAGCDILTYLYSQWGNGETIDADWVSMRSDSRKICEGILNENGVRATDSTYRRLLSTPRQLSVDDQYDWFLTEFKLNMYPRLKFSLLDDGRTLLMTAALLGHYQWVEALCKNGAVINVQDAEGRTAAMLAAVHDDDHSIVGILRRYGADLTITDNQGRTIKYYQDHTKTDDAVNVLAASFNELCRILPKEREPKDTVDSLLKAFDELRVQPSASSDVV